MFRELLFAVIVASLVGALFGAGSAVFYVGGLAPLCLGLGAAAGAGYIALRLGGGPTRRTWYATGVAVAGGLLMLQLFDDHHLRSHFRSDLAAARFADSGLGTEGDLDDGTIEFLARDADALLEAQVVAAHGRGGLLGRWLFRADLGIRLLGTWESSRFLHTGPWGAGLWLIFELMLGIAAAGALLRRIQRLATGPVSQRSE